MRSLLTWMLFLLASQVALAAPNVVQSEFQGVVITAPSGWFPSAMQQPIPVLMVQETRDSSNTPTLLLAELPAAQADAYAQQLITSTIRRPAQIGAETNPLGLVLQVWRGVGVDGPARVAVLRGTLTPNGTVMIAALAAPEGRFDDVGGAGLLLAFAAGTGSSAVAPSVATAPVGDSLNVPVRYRNSGTPTLYYMADALQTLAPAQVAAGMRQLNPTELQLLGVYSAFANLLHSIGCSADPSLPLAAGGGIASCQQTAVSWQQTLQFTGGDMSAALTQALNERGQFLIGAQCGDGSNDPASCASYRQTLSAMNAMSHETSMRIISNMSSDGCLMGDPGCVAY